MATLITFIVSLALSAGLSWIAVRVFPRIGLLDRPHKYGLNRKPIPYPGGLAVFGAFLIAAMNFLPMSTSVLAVMMGATLLVLVSFIDDRRHLPPLVRLFFQFAAAFILVAGGIGISSVTNPLGGTFVLDSLQWNIPLGNFSFTIVLFANLLTIVWVIAMVNAFNWIDGVPGMANSVAAISALVLLILSLRPGFHFMDQSLSIALSSIILGLSLGHLIFDFPPPKMILGDTGSMLLGFLLAVTAIISGGKIATTMLVLGFPILDFAWVILRRILKGKSPFKGDLWHFHHRLLKAGFSQRKVVIFFAATSAIFGTLALLLQTEGKLLAFIGILGVMVLLTTVFYLKRS